MRFSAEYIRPAADALEPLPSDFKIGSSAHENGQHFAIAGFSAVGIARIQFQEAEI
jgi:hypothetical protein